MFSVWRLLCCPAGALCPGLQQDHPQPPETWDQVLPPGPDAHRLPGHEQRPRPAEVLHHAAMNCSFLSEKANVRDEHHGTAQCSRFWKMSLFAVTKPRREASAREKRGGRKVKLLQAKSETRVSPRRLVLPAATSVWSTSPWDPSNVCISCLGLSLTNNYNNLLQENIRTVKFTVKPSFVKYVLS